MYKNLKPKPNQVSPTEIKSANAKDIKSLDTMRKLLVGHGNSIEDKIATVKTAQLVDNGRFENAFKALMKR